MNLSNGPKTHQLKKDHEKNKVRANMRGYEDPPGGGVLAAALPLLLPNTL